MTTHKNSVQYFFCGPTILQESLKGLSFASFSNKTSPHSKSKNEVYCFT